MPRKKSTTLRCPTCRKLVLRTDPEFPFCSERCRTIDLGKWASGGYVISTPVNDPESGGEAEYNEPMTRRTGGVLKGPATDDDQHSRKPN
ncbi:MAG TPA: DNA gyrase inhibitor YacG [candidate division Zixibacteria bacterium]|nr:DNA gyrase inhibitor YacG [candidate division Zixibacteria bacterium]